MERVKKQGLLYKLAFFVGIVTQRTKEGYSDGKYVGKVGISGKELLRMRIDKGK